MAGIFIFIAMQAILFRNTNFELNKHNKFLGCFKACIKSIYYLTQLLNNELGVTEILFEAKLL